MRSIIKFMMPSFLVSFIQTVLAKFRLMVMQYCSKNDFLASVYYVLVSDEFRKENRAVLNGRLEYENNIKSPEDSSALLRRNIHRIEKGLIMQPRKSVFAEGYIEETVNALIYSIASKKVCKNELKWAVDVLTEYFENVEGTPVTNRSLKKFQTECLDDIKMNTDKKFKPYLYKELPERQVSYEELANLFQRRRSVRWFNSKKVELDVIKKSIDMASTAPSACNRQPYKFYFSNDKSKTLDLATCAMGTAGFVENIPSILVVTGDLSYYPFERDRHVIYIDAALASMQLMLTLDTLGLASCPINWPDIKENEEMIRKVLNISIFERIVMLIAVGYPDVNSSIPFSQKKPAELLIEEVI